MAEEFKNHGVRVGFIGIGHLGKIMAERLLNAGYCLTVFDRNEKKTKPLLDQGAALGDSPRDLASRSDIIMSSVTNDDALRDIMMGQRGVLAGAKPGSVIIDFTTVYPDTSRALFAAAREKGIACLDAKLSGTTPQASEGTLVIVVGGTEEAFEKYKPVLDVLGKDILYAGGPGSGAIMKLVMNTILAVGMQGVAEAIALGEKAGIRRAQLTETLAKTRVIGPVHVDKLKNAATGEYPTTFSIQLMRKDFGLIMRQAAELGVAMPATAVSEQLCAAQAGKGLEEDFSAVIKLMEEMSGVHIVQTRLNREAALEDELGEDVVI